jgi:sec-independent protein translocase protein TatA
MIGFGLPQGGEWLIILAVVLLLFGHRLPGMARSLGSSITSFKDGLKDGAKPKDTSVDHTEDPSGGDSDSSGSGSAR